MMTAGARSPPIRPACEKQTIHIISHSRFSVRSTLLCLVHVSESVAVHVNVRCCSRGAEAWPALRVYIWWYALVHKLLGMLVCKAPDLGPPQVDPPGASSNSWGKTKLRQHLYYVSTELQLRATPWLQGGEGGLQRFSVMGLIKNAERHKDSNTSISCCHQMVFRISFFKWLSTISYSPDMVLKNLEFTMENRKYPVYF